MRPALLASSLVLFVCGGAVALLATFGSEVVTFRYDTYAEAITGDSFAGGWLPKFVPASARNIVMHNNASMNTSTGEFHFDPADTATFLAQVRPFEEGNGASGDFDSPVINRNAEDYRVYSYRDGVHFWVFFVNADQGHVIYDLTYTRISPAGTE